MLEYFWIFHAFSFFHGTAGKTCRTKYETWDALPPNLPTLSQIESKCVKLGQIESNWTKLSQIESNWVELYQIESNESNWVNLSQIESN